MNAKATNHMEWNGRSQWPGFEALATIRALWDSAGELVNRDSPYFPLRNAVFDLPPYRGMWPEIWVAAHGPRM